MSKPTLPTYQTIAATLEGKTGSGLALVGWTIARAALIAPPFMLIGVEPKKALAGAVLASSMISVFALARIYNASQEARATENSREAIRRRLDAARHHHRRQLAEARIRSRSPRRAPRRLPRPR
jgi:hypothetical protein